MRKIGKFHLSLYQQILGVKNNTSSSRKLGELGRLPFSISIETQLFKYLQRIPFTKEDCYLHKAFNEKLQLWAKYVGNLLGFTENLDLK